MNHSLKQDGAGSVIVDGVSIPGGELQAMTGDYFQTVSIIRNGAAILDNVPTSSIEDLRAPGTSFTADSIMDFTIAYFVSPEALPTPAGRPTQIALEDTGTGEDVILQITNGDIIVMPDETSVDDNITQSSF